MTNNTKTFYLKKDEWKFISEYCPNFHLKNKLLQENNTFILTLNGSEQKKLIDSLSNLFISIGLKDDYEPNKIGLQLEDLIDIFSPYK